MRSGLSTVAELADRIVQAVPSLDATGQRVAVSMYRLLGEGHPVPIRRIAEATTLPEAVVETILTRWPLFRDDHGAVIGFGGLTVAEMPPHRLKVNGRILYTWCAWDSLFIPGIFGKPAAVESVCPVTKVRISLEVGPEGIRNVTPPTTVVSFLTPDRTFDRDVIVNFCHFVHFFRNAEAAEVWLSRHPGTFLLSLDEAFALGQMTNARNFGLALRPAGDRYYDRVGLVRPAWRTGAGYRMYDETTVDRLHFIRRAKALGMSLADIRRILAVRDEGAAPCQHVLALVRDNLVKVEGQLTHLKRLRGDLRRLQGCSSRRSLPRSRRPSSAPASSSSQALRR